MDFREFVEDRNDGMYEILESSDIYCNYIGVNEGLIKKIKEIRSNKKAKKAAEAERKRLLAEEEAQRKKEANILKKEKAKASAMRNYVIDETGSTARNDFDKFIEQVSNIIRREIPGVGLENKKPRHNRTQLDDGYTLHKESVTVFKMSDKNLKLFIDSTKNNSLSRMHKISQGANAAKKINAVAKMAQGQLTNTNDYILAQASHMSEDKLKKLVDDDFKSRITDKIAGLGCKEKRGFLILDKDGQEYLTVKIEGMYWGYAITVGVKYITKG